MMKEKTKVGTTFTKEQLRPPRKRPVGTASLKPFQDRLRELGYRQTHRSTSIHNGASQYYERNVPSLGVRVEVQLWIKPNGAHDHLVSHYHKHRYTHEGKLVEVEPKDGALPGHMDTVPCKFRTVEGMVDAINFETGRDTDRATIPKDFSKHFG